jgi:hypothetical protein
MQKTRASREERNRERERERERGREAELGSFLRSRSLHRVGSKGVKPGNRNAGICFCIPVSHPPYCHHRSRSLAVVLPFVLIILSRSPPPSPSLFLPLSRCPFVSELRSCRLCFPDMGQKLRPFLNSKGITLLLLKEHFRQTETMKTGERKRRKWFTLFAESLSLRTIIPSRS